MKTQKIKQSKVAKFFVYFLILGIIYAGIGFPLIIFARQIGYLRNDSLAFGLLFFVLTAGAYIFLVRNKKIAKYKFIQRGVLYTLFFDFSAVAIFTILTPVIHYTDFLRFHIRGGVNLKIIFAPTVFYLAIACLITYTIHTSLMEIQKNKTKVLRQLIYWFLTTIIAGYSSLLLLFFYTGFDYQKKCLPKVGIASNYCYSIGESIYHWWQPVPALVVFIITTVFIILYFAKFKTEEK